MTKPTVDAKGKRRRIRFTAFRLVKLFSAFALLLSACGPHMPEEHDVTAGGHHPSSHGKKTANAVSCTDLKEKPQAGEPVKTFHLTARAGSLQLDSGKTVEDAWMFYGPDPQPELRVQEGDRVIVHVKNENIREGVTIHWHGVILPCSQDGVAGVTQDAIRPGETFTYEWIARHAGTYWYHSHQQSSLQARKGLIGKLVVEPKKPTFAYDKDVTVLLQELDDEQLANLANRLHVHADPGETVRLRVINSRNSTERLTVSGAPVKVVSIDGNDLMNPPPVEKARIPVGSGQRLDLLVNMPAQGAVKITGGEKKESVVLGRGPEPPASDGNRWPELDLTRYAASRSPLPAPKSFDQTHTLELDWSFPHRFTINGKVMHEIPPIVVREGEWIRLRIVAKGGAPHPMHLHGHRFAVLSKNGAPLPHPLVMDTVNVNQDESYEIAFLADNPGLWMIHCHNLTHAYLGMSMMINYEGVTTPHRIGTKSGNHPD
ncbi:multicopper oxidase family protein [Staphylospora marina]|uniref:multicopper oxidase family protein n=1 Tax=Staphylospora marina TaxID=2490858 RepID=UPI000F5BC02E|nr:multicopper oxidase family protein [Staphylospora marina]